MAQAEVSAAHVPAVVDTVMQSIFGQDRKPLLPKTLKIVGTEILHRKLLSISSLPTISLKLNCSFAACWLCKNITIVFDHLTKSTPSYTTALTRAYHILTDNLLTLTADMTAESGMSQTISSDLSAAVVQQTTLHLRTRITSCATSVHCCFEVLMLLATFDDTPEAVVSL